MSHAIYYTSAPEGLKRGTTGFCTVAATDNIPKSLWDRLETLSAYRHQYAAGAAAGHFNPVSFAHWMLNISGKTHHVLSRICDSGVDHTQRTNAFAHHLVLDRGDLDAAPGGPAWMLLQPGVMAQSWDGRVGSLPLPTLPTGDDTGASRICHGWAAATGDAGWGGHLADLFAKAPTRPVCILFAPDQNVLPLIAEAIALLPPAARWNVTFNTYFTSMPTSATCLWRCCLAGTPAAQTALRYAAAGLALDLTDRSRLPALPPGPYVNMARTGQTAPAAGPAAKMPQPSLAELKSRAASLKAPPRGRGEPLSNPDARDQARQDEEHFQLLADFDKLVDDSAAPPANDPDLDFAVDSDSTYSLKGQDLASPSATTVPGAGFGAAGRTIRRAEEALRAAEREAALAAARRRRQVLLLFGGAILALAVGSGLVYLSLRGGAPPSTIPLTSLPYHPRPIESQPVASGPNTGPTTIVATQPPATTTTTAVVETRPPETATQIAIPAITYPDVLTLTTALDKPNVGTGIGDRSQLLAFRIADLDPLPVNGLRLVLFPDQQDKLASSPAPAAAGGAAYRNSTLGTISAVPNAARSSVALYWRPASDPGLGTELAIATFDRSRRGLNIDWHATALLRNPTVFNYVFWVLQNSAWELDSARTAKQRLLMKPVTLPTVNFADPAAASFDLPWPVELPRDVRAVEPAAATLPTGWKADWYPDWDPKLLAAGRTPENSWQVISFKKHTDNPKIDAWFLVTFKPGAAGGLSAVDNTFGRRLAQDQADLAKTEGDLADVNKKISDLQNDPAMKAFGGTIPPELLARQADDKLAIDAYKAAVSGYNQLDGFAVAFELSDGVRLATLHFQRPKADTQQHP